MYSNAGRKASVVRSIMNTSKKLGRGVSWPNVDRFILGATFYAPQKSFARKGIDKDLAIAQIQLDEFTDAGRRKRLGMVVIDQIQVRLFLGFGPNSEPPAFGLAWSNPPCGTTPKI